VVTNLGSMLGADARACYLEQAAHALLHDGLQPLLCLRQRTVTAKSSVPTYWQHCPKNLLGGMAFWAAVIHQAKELILVTRAARPGPPATTWALANRWKASSFRSERTHSRPSKFTSDLIAFGSSVSVLTACWCPIQARHEDAQYQIPILASWGFALWQKGIAHIMMMGTVHKSVVRNLLARRLRTTG
jgi:hypothetical protein